MANKVKYNLGCNSVLNCYFQYFFMFYLINRFIVLLLTWFVLLFNDFYYAKLNNNAFVIFIFFGFVVSLLITWLWHKNNPENNQLYLSLGFYRHFWQLYWQNCLSSLKMIAKIALTPKKLQPITQQLEISQNQDLTLLVSFHFLSGIIVDNQDNKSIKINCVDACFLQKKKISFLFRSFQNIDDNQLI